MKHLLISFILILGISQATQAQEGYELGGWIGLSHYFGDLNTNSSFSSPGLAAGLAARHNFNTRVSFTLGFGFGQVSAADSTSTNSYQLKRNLSFKSNVFDFSAMLEFNFFEYFHGSYDQFYTPYIFGGLAVSKYNPKAFHEGEWHSLRDLGTEGQTQGNEYVLATLALAYGAGVKFDINKDWSINVALSGRKLMSDYLDDVSTVYPDAGKLFGTRGQLAVDLSDRSLDGDFATEGFQRGNIRDKDYYYFLSIGVMRYFGDIKCPKISIINP